MDFASAHTFTTLSSRLTRGCIAAAVMAHNDLAKMRDVLDGTEGKQETAAAGNCPKPAEPVCVS